LSFLCTEVGSKPETLIWSGDLHANGENHGFQVKKLFFHTLFPVLLLFLPL